MNISEKRLKKQALFCLHFLFYSQIIIDSGVNV